MDVLNTADYGGFCLNDFGKMGFDAGDAMGLNDPLPGRAKDYSADFGRILGLGTVTVHLDTVHITLEHDELVLLDVKLPPNELLSTVGKVRLENVTKYRRVYDSGVSQYLTWLTFRIAQHFAVPLLPGIPQPGKDAPPLRFPHPQDHSSLKLRWVDVTNSCPESFNISIPSLPFVVSPQNNLDSPLPVANVITHPFVWTHANITIQVC